MRSSNIQYSVLILFDVVTRKQDTNERRILVYCLRLEKDERGKYEFYVFPKKTLLRYFKKLEKYFFPLIHVTIDFHLENSV